MNPLDLAALALGYVLGSIPFGLLLTRLAGTPDIRGIGSGNIGATNVLRTGRKDLAAITLVCDALKGTLAVVLASRWGEGPSLFAAAGAFVGHVFPVWLRFRGGKGVATFLGTLLGFAWPVGLAFCAIWIAVAAAFRFSSAAALAAGAAAPIGLFLLGRRDAAALYLILAAALWVFHRANIARLRAGTESRIGASASPPPTDAPA